MDKTQKMIWYEITVTIVPQEGCNKFYIGVNKWEQYEERGNVRIEMTPDMGKYDNFNEYCDATSKVSGVRHLTIADTITSLEEALELEEILVQGFRSSEENNGFNKRRKED